jgi:hypothetical protein
MKKIDGLFRCTMGKCGKGYEDIGVLWTHIKRKHMNEPWLLARSGMPLRLKAEWAGWKPLKAYYEMQEQQINVIIRNPSALPDETASNSLFQFSAGPTPTQSFMDRRDGVNDIFDDFEQAWTPSTDANGNNHLYQGSEDRNTNPIGMTQGTFFSMDLEEKEDEEEGGEEPDLNHDQQLETK